MAGAEIVPLPPNKKRKDFVPDTGNPENGDYGDWERFLKEKNGGKGADVVPLKPEKDPNTP